MWAIYPKEPQQCIPRRPLLQVQVAGQRRQTSVSQNRHNLPQGHPRIIEMGGQYLQLRDRPPYSPPHPPPLIPVQPPRAYSERVKRGRTMQIKGFGSDQADQLAPEQWVNDWENTITGLEFHCTCQVAELGELATEDYALEPIGDSPPAT